MHHLLPDQESAIKLSILSVFCPGKFSRVESNYVFPQCTASYSAPLRALALHGLLAKRSFERDRLYLRRNQTNICVIIMKPRSLSAPTKRASRNANPVSPYDRIKAVFGKEHIKNRLQKALNDAVDERRVLQAADFPPVEDNNLRLIGIPVHSIELVCKVSSATKRGYPTIKFRLDKFIDKLVEKFGENQKQFDNSSVPLDLHRLTALMNCDWDESQMKNHAIHRCHRKECFNPLHVYFGTTELNLSTDFCSAYMLINNTLVSTCQHEKKCLAPGLRSAHRH